MADPTLILLDEPSLGLGPTLMIQATEMIQSIRDRGITILLVEQNADLALRMPDRANVLWTGDLAMEGASRDLLGDPWSERRISASERVARRVGVERRDGRRSVRRLPASLCVRTRDTARVADGFERSAR
jgi:ABC-type transporter Mla maintaining outer membrane lipid asymmetry ATPase subunit MlaF